MVRYSCHIHLTGVIREVAVAPHHMVTVAPAGADERCDHGRMQRSKGFGLGLTSWYGACGKRAIWAVNPQ